MRVALVWPDLSEEKAVGIRGVVFARVFRKLGGEVIPILPQGATSPADLEAIRLRLFDHPRNATILGGFKLQRLLSKLRADVVFASSPPAMLAFEAAWASRRAGIPFVLDVRDLATESLRAAFGPRLRYRVLEWMEKEAYRQARDLLVVSSIMKEEIAQMGVPPHSIHLVPNGSLPLYLPTLPKDIDLLFLGYLPDEGRRPRGLLQSIRIAQNQRPGTTVAFVGWKESPFTHDLRSHLSKLDPPPLLVPPVRREEVAFYLARSKIGLVSLLNRRVFRTAVGVKTYEYLRAGLPVAALGVEGDSELRRLVEGEGVGIFSSKEEELGPKIAQLLSHPERLEELSERSRRVGERFDRFALAERAWNEVFLRRGARS